MAKGVEVVAIKSLVAPEMLLHLRDKKNVVQRKESCFSKHLTLFGAQFVQYRFIAVLYEWLSQKWLYKWDL